MNRIAIVGHFGGSKKFTDGQTVKTVNLYNELTKCTDWDILKVDTYYKSRQPLRLLIQLVRVMVTTKDIIILFSTNGRRFLFPLFYIFSLVFKKNVYHNVIGGSLAMDIENYPRYRRYLNSFRVNWTETEFLKKELERQGICNVAVLPNFRRMQSLRKSDLNSVFSEPYAFCTFSRVIKEKGIEDAISAIQKVNENHGHTVCRLDIYGPVGKDYQEQFEAIMAQSDACIRYCGEVSSDKAVDILSGFYATLFPTYWESESNAGTVTESFFAGVPVIATDWRCNPEMIINGYNGIVYPSDMAKTLEEAIQWMLDRKECMGEIKKNCLESAKKYHPDLYMNQVIDFIERTHSESVE